MLDADDVGVGPIDLASGGHVADRSPLTYPPADLRAVGADGASLVDRGDPALRPWVGLPDRVDQIRGERRDAASTRGIGGNERDPHTTSLPVRSLGASLAQRALSARGYSNDRGSSFGP